MTKTIKENKPIGELHWNCRFHPTDWWHEIGCPHMEWSKGQVQEALESAKRSNDYITHAYILKDREPITATAALSPQPRTRKRKTHVATQSKDSEEK